MLSRALNSNLAIKINFQLIQIQTKIRDNCSTNKDNFVKFELLETKLVDYNDKILLILDFSGIFCFISSLQNYFESSLYHSV
jgi:hypothetical protein